MQETSLVAIVAPIKELFRNKKSEFCSEILVNQILTFSANILDLLERQNPPSRKRISTPTRTALEIRPTLRTMPVKAARARVRGLGTDTKLTPKLGEVAKCYLIFSSGQRLAPGR